MVSPHPDWEDVADGYRSGENAIFVEPAVVADDGRVAVSSSVRLTPDTASAFVVGVWTASSAWEIVIAFDDARSAWEFANLLTHYFDGRGDLRAARRALLPDDEGFGGPLDVPAILAETRPEDVLEALLAPTPVPEEVAAVVGK
ncbi:hypothetical protein [Halovivax sp.]|uniref:hypothetical protein n=1 Tax=Halovivax sp. TaxID=1935978 RepID=UPI0025C67D33|nr:hypothetical protein [Halovivax sp.]